MVDRSKLLVLEAILSHEAEARLWLVRRLKNMSDAEDVIQEAYCRLWAMDDISRIANPKAYFFRMVRNIAIDHIRNTQAAAIDNRSALEDMQIPSEEADPERTVLGRWEFRYVRRLIDSLPRRCRTIFLLRKVEGISQREIAERLGVTEHVVENDVARGLKMILQAVAEGRPATSERPSSRSRRR